MRFLSRLRSFFWRFFSFFCRFFSFFLRSFFARRSSSLDDEEEDEDDGYDATGRRTRMLKGGPRRSKKYATSIIGKLDFVCACRKGGPKVVVVTLPVI